MEHARWLRKLLAKLVVVDGHLTAVEKVDFHRPLRSSFIIIVFSTADRGKANILKRMTLVGPACLTVRACEWWNQQSFILITFFVVGLKSSSFYGQWRQLRSEVGWQLWASSPAFAWAVILCDKCVCEPFTFNLGLISDRLHEWVYAVDPILYRLYHTWDSGRSNTEK